MDPRRFGPTRGELVFRLAFASAGLMFLVVAVAIPGISNTAALVELFGIAGLFLAGTLVWAARRLILGLHP